METQHCLHSSKMDRAKNSALSSAVTLLARRDHSENEIRTKLRRRGYSDDEIGQAVERLRQRGYLDDAALCLSLATTLWHSGKWGARGVASRLHQQGFSGSMIQTAMEALDREEELQHAIALLQPRPHTAADREKNGRFLSARGFSYSVIENALEYFVY